MADRVFTQNIRHGEAAWKIRQIRVFVPVLQQFAAICALKKWYNTARSNHWYGELVWRGRVVWFSAHAWKACNLKGFAGSNPALSAPGNPGF